MPFEYVTTDAQATSELMGGDITAPTLAAIATRETFQVIAGTQSAHGRVEPRTTEARAATRAGTTHSQSTASGAANAVATTTGSEKKNRRRADETDH